MWGGIVLKGGVCWCGGWQGCEGGRITDYPVCCYCLARFVAVSLVVCGVGFAEVVG